MKRRPAVEAEFAFGPLGDTALVTDRQTEDLVDQAEDVAGDVASHDWFKRLARFGMVARGILYLVVALLALRIATGDFDERADKQGALQAVVRQPLGKVLIVALAVGFAGYALWRFVEAVIGPPNEQDRRKATFKRLGYAARGLLYTGLFASTVRLLVGADEGESAENAATDWTARVLSWPGGRLLVAAVGIGVVGAGIWVGWRGWKQKFAKKLKNHEMDIGERKWILRLGTVGNIARMVVFVLIGVLLGGGGRPDRSQCRGRRRRSPPPTGGPAMGTDPALLRRPRAGRLRSLLPRRGPLPAASCPCPCLRD